MLSDWAWVQRSQYWKCRSTHVLFPKFRQATLSPCLDQGTRRCQGGSPLLHVHANPQCPPLLYKAVSRLVQLFGNCLASTPPAQPGVMTGLGASLPPPSLFSHSHRVLWVCLWNVHPFPDETLPSSLLVWIIAKANQIPKLHCPWVPLPLGLLNSPNLKAGLLSPPAYLKLQILSTQAICDPDLLFLFYHISPFPACILHSSLWEPQELRSRTGHVVSLGLPFDSRHTPFPWPRTLLPPHFTRLAPSPPRTRLEYHHLSEASLATLYQTIHRGTLTLTQSFCALVTISNTI